MVMLISSSYLTGNAFAQTTWETFNEKAGLFSLQMPSNWVPQEVPVNIISNPQGYKGPIDYKFSHQEDVLTTPTGLEIDVGGTIYIGVDDKIGEIRKVLQDSIIAYEEPEGSKLLQPLECSKFVIDKASGCSFTISTELHENQPIKILKILSVSNPNEIGIEVTFTATEDKFEKFLPVAEYMIKTLKFDTEKVASTLGIEPNSSSNPNQQELSTSSNNKSSNSAIILASELPPLLNNNHLSNKSNIAGTALSFAHNDKNLDQTIPPKQTTNFTQTGSIDSFLAEGIIDSEILGPMGSCELTHNSQKDQSIIPVAYSVIPVVVSPETLWKLNGSWEMSVQKGNLTEFWVNFTMQGENLDSFHEHQLSNFRAVDVGYSPINSNISLSPKSDNELRIKGIMDYKETCHKIIRNVPVELNINTGKYGNTIDIVLDGNKINNHFAGYEGDDNIVYGEITSSKDVNGKEFLNKIVNSEECTFDEITGECIARDNPSITDDLHDETLTRNN